MTDVNEVTGGISVSQVKQDCRLLSENLSLECSMKNLRGLTMLR